MRKYPTTTGIAYVDEAEIVAILPITTDADGSNSTARVHMRGGSVINVTESAEAAYQRATQPATAQATPQPAADAAKDSE